VRLVDFKKFKYEEAKKERIAKRKTKETDTKEIWLGPLISGHDLMVRVEQARNFLKVGDRVKFTVKFAGREITHPELGRQVLNKALNQLADIAEKEGEPRFVGRALSLSLQPIKKGPKHETKDKQNSEKTL
jgi:translation initiation factor IF-3